ncbi:MAG: hypothetical protein D6830_03695 [Ignavibacteria bacterium]|nr:MAG: hypothetical protein D6830_03695 [Ignavibacteria bacterium]
MKVFFIAVLFLSVSLSAQNKITKQEYDSQYDSLLKAKETLLSQKEELKKEINLLEDKKEELEQKLQDCLPSFFIKKYGREIGNRIAAGRVWTGMTEEMLLDSYGKPDKVNRNKEKWGTFAQYYYGKIIFFFRDGKLIEWEEKK